MSDIGLDGWRQRLGAGLPGWLGRQGVIALVLLGPILAISTAFALGSGDSNPSLVRIVLLVDLCYLLALVALIGIRVGQLVMARRRRRVGSQLHLRLTGVFAVIAFVPTVIVAIFATLSINLGIETWFSDRVGSVVRNALATAEAYEREHRNNIRGDILAMANDLNRAVDTGVEGDELADLVRQQALIRELPEAFVFNSQKEILARGEFSYLFSFEAPTLEQLARARAGEVVIMEDDANNEIRALVYLTNFFDAFLYVSRDVQGEVLRLLDETQATVQLYEQLERDRSSLLFDFALIYLGFAALVIVAAILLGLWFAERLAKPVGRLAGAAERIGSGDLDARVKEERGSDEIALLSRAFNRMADQVRDQRDALIDANRETELRRQFSEAVLSGVSAGVIGIDREGRIDLVNAAGADLLGLDGNAMLTQEIVEVASGFGALIAGAARAPGGIARGEVRQTVDGQPREFLARYAPRVPDSPEDGHVLTFDDITALASAQRMAAWGDVARRIAHEIKNPLTPIQLSADRLKRKYVGLLGGEGPKFEQYIEVITRQTADIRRMVDEFSKFARMPEPKLAEEDFCELLRDAVLLQREGRSDINYGLDLPPVPAPVLCDRTMVAQVLTNLLQNAADAIDSRAEREAGKSPPGRIQLRLVTGERNYRLSLTDNGIGLPAEDRSRLTDPYVTTRKSGTGLGLAIVTKILEQHGGELALGDADGAAGLDGAKISLRLPRPVRTGQHRHSGRTTGSRAVIPGPA
ncbi:MAG: PAS domain-containing sensor histidine kinase [Pseudomonadota bacterium]